MIEASPVGGGPRRAAFLDRDGVLIEILRDPDRGILYTAFHPDHLLATRGALDSLRRLGELGYQRIVVTNQPGPAKGHFDESHLERMHQRLREMFEGQIDAVYHCPHHPEGGTGGNPALVQRCDCRKPRPGMLLRAARERGIDLATSVLIGDSPDDVRAGQAAGVRTILLNGGRCELCPNRGAGAVTPDATVPSLPEAVAWIEAGANSRGGSAAC